MRTDIPGIGDPGKPVNEAFCREASGQETGDVSETWMGVYMQGVKVGYSHSREFDLVQDGKFFQKSIQESYMKVSRLGGNPVEISTSQDSLYDAEKNPVATTIRTKLSLSETVIRAEVKPDRIVFFFGDKITKELPYTEKFYLGVPLDEIIEDNGLSAGKEYTFKILEPLTQSLIDISFEVLQEESILILIDQLKSEHPVIRSQAASALGALKDERTIMPLSPLLEDPDWFCRHHAASAIYRIGESGKRFLRGILMQTEDPYAKDIINHFLTKPLHPPLTKS